MSGTRAAARDVYRASVVAGKPMSGGELGDRFGRSASWGRSVAAEVRAESNGHGDAQPAGCGPLARHADASERQARRQDNLAAPAVTPAAPVDRQARRQWFDTGVTLVVAVVAALASFGHMYDVALLAGEPVWIARAWPITVDGLAIAALRRGEQGRWWLLLALAVSVASNVLAQYPAMVSDIAPGVSAWPPVALYGTHRLLTQRQTPARNGPTSERLHASNL